jgi:hypothetical protein
MDFLLAQDNLTRSKIDREWEQWRKYKRFYPDVVKWWERHVKKHLKRLIRREEEERNKKHNIMENHLYECLYDILRGETPETDKYYTLKLSKRK